MNAIMTWTAAVSILAAAAPASSTKTDVETRGSLSGSFRCLQRLKTRGDTSQKDVVLYLTSKEAKSHSPASTPSVVAQEKLRFEPHAIPVLRGSRVSFVNKDSVKHNVYTSADCCSIDSEMDTGESSEFTFDEAGVVSIVCRLHPEMSCWIIVLDEPWFTHVQLEKGKTEAGDRVYQSTYEITNVPAGAYTLTFWNKALEPLEFEVEIKAGETSTFDVVIPE